MSRPRRTSKAPLSQTVSGPGSTMSTLTCAILSSASSPPGPGSARDDRRQRGRDVDAERSFRRQLAELRHDQREQRRRDRQRRDAPRPVEVDAGERGPHEAALGLPAQQLIEGGARDAETDPVGSVADRGGRPEARGTAPAGAYEAVKFGAPGGGMHCPGPLPMLAVKLASAPNVMPVLSSAIWKSGASIVIPSPEPTAPEIDIPGERRLDRVRDRAVLRPRRRPGRRGSR